MNLISSKDYINPECETSTRCFKGEDAVANNTATIGADEKLVKAAQKVVDKYKFLGKSEKDAITGKPITLDEYTAAVGTIAFFAKAIGIKKTKLAAENKKKAEQKKTRKSPKGELIL